MRRKKDIFSIGDEPDDQPIRNRYKVDGVENSFTPGEARGDYVTSGFELVKLRWLIISVIVVFSALSFRVGYLQITKGSGYRSAAEDNRIRIQEIKPPRGIIYDRNGITLAHNIPNFTLSVITADLPSDQAERSVIYRRIAGIVGLKETKIQQPIEQLTPYSFQSAVILDHIPYEQALKLEIAAGDLPGITLNATTFREYLAGNQFSSVLGYMGKVSPEELRANPSYLIDDTVGKSGIEQLYDASLRGVSGKKEIEVNSLGKESKVITETKPTSGEGIELTIDSGLQQVLNDSLEQAFKKSRSITGASAVALDPRNGEVLALVTYPTYDNNKFTLGLTANEYRAISEDPKKPLFNRSISAEYPSGSTIKPVIAAAALQERIVTPSTTFLSTGGIQIDKWFFPDWKSGGHGVTNLRKALAESVNTYFYMVGGGDDTFTGLGIERMVEYFKRFGLGEKTQIDLPGEVDGFLPSKQWKVETKHESWYIGDTYHVSIGQGDILVTPLQVASYTATIANGGTRYQPRLAKRFLDPQGSVIRETPPLAKKTEVINAANLQAVREGMREAVLSGSAQAIASVPVSSGAKTGTAQFGNEGKTHAWFTSFAPYEDPQIVVTVVVEAGGEGHETALPVARDALQYWFTK